MITKNSQERKERKLTNQWLHQRVDWGGHVHPSCRRGRFSSFFKSAEKLFWGGVGVAFH